MKYIISTDEISLRNHPEFERLTQPGESVVWEDRHSQNPTIYLGHEHSRHYFFSDSRSLEPAIQELCRAPYIDVTIRQASREALPESLASMYERLFNALVS